jgi:protein-tyrosine phosphatase
VIHALFWVALVVWAMGVNLLAFRLREHLRNPHEKEFFGLFPRQIYILDFFRPSLFTPDGARLRRSAAWWFVAGAGVVFLIGVLM